jgi:hypothetical protein
LRARPSNRFRRTALNLPGAIEGTHQGHTDFRMNGRIFAMQSALTLAWTNIAPNSFAEKPPSKKPLAKKPPSERVDKAKS